MNWGLYPQIPLFRGYVRLHGLQKLICLKVEHYARNAPHGEARRMSSDDTTMDGPESLIPYEEWMIDGMRRIIYLSLWRTAEYGLPGDHHFYITFKTQHPDVFISPSLKARFPDEMRIVIQHQYGSLDVNEDSFSITLQFGGVPETLNIAYKAVSQFVDPAVHFALDFDVDMVAAETTPKPAGPRLVNTDGNIARLSPATNGEAAVVDRTKEPTSADQASSAAPDGEPGTQPATADGSHAGESTNKVVTLDAFRQKKKED